MPSWSLSIPFPSFGWILARPHDGCSFEPIDRKRLGGTPAPGAVMGHDYAGIVVAVGSL
jgi:NADPH:quinone reductase-like Zn-dependent oxidoreductase